MHKSPSSYRFSLRDLFLFMLACSLLLFEWKMWGIVSLLGTVTTLVCGAAVVWLFVAHPPKNSPSATINYLLISVINMIVVLMELDSIRTLEYFNGTGVVFFSLLLTTAIAFGLLRLMAEPKWSAFFPFLFVLYIWVGYLLVQKLIHPYPLHSVGFGMNLIRGYGTAMAVLAISVLLGWVRWLPTTRDDLAQ